MSRVTKRRGTKTQAAQREARKRYRETLDRRRDKTRAA